MLNILWIFMMVGGIVFAAVHGTMDSVTDSFLSSSTEAIKLCIYMLGVMGVWSGMMEIGIASGLMKQIEKALSPFIEWLFPDIAKEEKVKEYMSVNIAANILGLGWAATPAGLKTMEELQKINGKHMEKSSFQKNMLEKADSKRMASDTMCGFLVLNISSLQLIPINMVAYRAQYGSVDPAGIILPAMIATLVSTIAGILFIKLMTRRKHG